MRNMKFWAWYLSIIFGGICFVLAFYVLMTFIFVSSLRLMGVDI